MNERERAIVERELGFIDGLSAGVREPIGGSISASVEVIRETLQNAGVLYKDGRTDDR